MRFARVLATCLLLAILVTATACGRKGPPFIAQKDFKLGVVRLTGERVGGRFHLKGDIQGPGNQKGARASIKGCRIYYAEYLERTPPCADCPIAYQGYYGFGSEVVTDGKFFCRVPGKREGRIYFFKVYLLCPEGSMGPPSNRIQVAVD